MALPTFTELRDQLQSPRRQVDTFYGRTVMRFFSIYITALGIRLNVTPLFVTTLSLVVGGVGVVAIFLGQWIAGVVLLNLWYLLDHVDGELARYYGSSSVTGLFFDTILNPILFPLFFFAYGYQLAHSVGHLWVYVGLIAAYGTMMLLIVGYCESNSILHWLTLSNRSQTDRADEALVSQGEKKHSIAKRLFVLCHRGSAFPLFLMVFTAVILVNSVISLLWVHVILISVYTFCVTVSWIGLLSKAVLTSHVENRLRSISEKVSKPL